MDFRKALVNNINANSSYMNSRLQSTHMRGPVNVPSPVGNQKAPVRHRFSPSYHLSFYSLLS
jgi:hypothetical protein